jgi:hypothetical protein
VFISQPPLLKSIKIRSSRYFAGPAAAESLDGTAGLRPESSICHSGFEPTEAGWLGRGREGGILGGECESSGGAVEEYECVYKKS